MRYADFRCLKTDRLVLRDIRMEDIQEYYERLFGDGDVARYMLFDPHQDISESLAGIRDTLDAYAEGKCYRWGIALAEDDSLIGLIQLLRFEEDTDTCSFVYMLGCNYWNQGYATEALKVVIRFAFEEMQIRRIVADHMTKKPASGAVMRKAGMTHIGTEPGKYEKYGIRYDAELYEICRPETAGMTVDEYQKLALRTVNPALSRRELLINGVMGLCGESGEAIDLVKKHLHHGHELDKTALVKELGDIAWYLAETAYALDVSLEDVLQGNIEKLKKRYPEGFSSERSRNRE